MEKTNSLSWQAWAMPRKTELMLTGAYTTAAFAVPFLMGHPQLLVGSVVNAALVLTALSVRDYKIMPIIFLPSIAVLARGIIFGPLTPYLYYALPIVWIGNSALVFGIKYLMSKKINKYLSLALSIGVKVGLLYFVTLLLIGNGILPKIFAVSMGMLQLYTALIGTVLALGLNFIIKKTSEEK